MIRHRHVVFAAVLAIVLPAGWPALSEDPLQKAGQELRSAGDKAGHAIEKGVEKAGTAIKKAGQDVGRTVDRVTGKDKVAETGASGVDAALEAFVEYWSKALVAKDRTKVKDLYQKLAEAKRILSQAESEQLGSK